MQDEPEVDLMDDETLQSRLSRISTSWTVLAQAHQGAQAASAAARLEFIRRYQRAVYRYLLGAVRNADAADDLFQDFALQFIRGDFQHADPHRGRFRDYLKTSLYHSVVDHFRRQAKRGIPLETGAAEPVTAAWGLAESDQQFTSSWRTELLSRVWTALAEGERAGGQPYHSVLKFRVEHPDLPSPELARQLSVRLQRSPPFTETGIRKTLQRARTTFADLLLQEVAASLGNPPLDELEAELIDLDLINYCRSAMRRRKQG
jgi:RNA polymerase sigma-70 factor (ECF subfamily)